MQYLALKPVYLPRRLEEMTVHGRPAHDPTTLDLMKGHQGSQEDPLKPLLIWHVDLNQAWIGVDALHIRITWGAGNVALNSHQLRRIHRDDGLTTQLPYGPLTHQELSRPWRSNPYPQMRSLHDPKYLSALNQGWRVRLEDDVSVSDTIHRRTTLEKRTGGQSPDPSWVPPPSKRKYRVRGRWKPTGSKHWEMLERPEDGKLPEAEEADRLSMGEATQTPDVKPICQHSPIIIPQSVDIPEHDDDGCGYNGLVIAKEAAEDEVSNPLMIS
jgi:hypothetical protein